MYSIIVVYNQKISDSVTYRALRLQPDMEIIVCDNSTENNNNQTIVEADGYTYVSMGGNQGLSKAYNQALDTLKGKEGYVCIFDDDTIIDESYFNTVKQSIQTKKDIYVPYVTDGTSVISPSIIENDIVSKMENEEQLDYHHLTAINSGMVISLSVFQDYRYTEELFLDYVDHQFLKDMKHQQRSIEVMDCTIRQNFSANEINKKNAMERFQIFKKDSRYFYRFYKKGYQYVVNKRKLRLFMTYKDVRFLLR